MSYKVYEYGQSHWTKIDEAAALEQISRRHKMWNKLVELDHAYRANVYDVLRDETQEKIDAESSTIEALVSKIRARRKAARKRTVDLGTLREELAAARERKRALVDAAKARRKQLVDERKAALDELRTAHWEAPKQAAHETNLYWCNYDDALRCYDVAAKRAARAGVELRFRRRARGERAAARGSGCGRRPGLAQSTRRPARCVLGRRGRQPGATGAAARCRRRAPQAGGSAVASFIPIEATELYPIRD